MENHMKKTDTADHIFGQEVRDPFRWLENELDEDTIAWSHTQKEKSSHYFSESETEEEDRKRLTEMWDYPKYFVPVKVKDTLYYQKNDGLQNQASLYMKRGAVNKVILDPNSLSEDGTVALIQTAVSKQGRYLAYSTSEHGSDWQQIRVKDLESGHDLPDKIDHVKFTNIAWTPDEKGFYYSRFDLDEQEGLGNDKYVNKLYYHSLHTFQTEDQLIYEHPENDELLLSPFVTEDGQYLCLHISEGTASANRFYFRRIGAPTQSFLRLFDQQDAEYSFAGNIGSTFFFKTDLNSPKGKIVSINLDDSGEPLIKEIAPENDSVITDAKFANGMFVVTYLKNARHEIHIIRADGQYLHEVTLPQTGSLTGVTCSADDPYVYFGIASFLNPGIIYQYNLDNEGIEEFARSTLSFNTDEYETNQVFYKSKDGTTISMFVTHKKDIVLSGENSVILTGYGGFNISLTPSFNPAVLRWLEKGGVYAVANLRGGGELGEEWHRAGMLQNKQNVFDDFISASEWLIDEGYTNSKKLSIMGGSNGGLLVAASMTQRPDLFGAVICRVPVIDMLRYHKFTIGSYWIPEYGHPENKDHFSFLYRYSPLHNIKQGQLYPSLLVATAESDDRVVPAHAKKFVATLSDQADPSSTLVLRLESKAGHGLGKPTSKVIDEWVDFYTFLDKELE
ncbi:prolyl oligopeptidase family serine peptidase [Salipaludibacillus keqinensis]|nr:prolyl oligopeptidase family serine peptidase [Salipaludibacillus keqinensis]